MKERLLLIDGYNLAFRSFYAVPSTLETSQNVPVNALYGFVRIFLSAIETLSPDYVVVCLDARAQTFRSMADKEYKAQRKATPEPLKIQLELLVKQLLPGLRIPFLVRDGYEADDLIAGCCRKFADELEVVIISNDRDLYPLLSRNQVAIYFPDKKKSPLLYTEDDFIKEYAIQPSQFVLFKALAGDASDNIKGVPGIGPKTAIRLIQQHGSLDQMLNSSESRWSTILQEKKTLVLHNLALVQLLDQVSIDQDKDALRFNKVCPEDMVEIARAFEFHSLLKTYQKQTTANHAQESPIEVQSLENFSDEKIQSWLDLDEWTFLYFEEKSLMQAYHPQVGILEDVIKKNTLLQEENSLYSDADKMKNTMKSLFLSSSRIITFDAKKLMHLLNIDFCQSIPEVDDLQVMFYLLHPNLKQYGMDEFMLRYGDDHQEMNAENLAEACPWIQKELEKLHLIKVYRELEKPLIKVLYDMERQGINIAIPELEKIKAKLLKLIAQTASEIHAYAEDDFNIASPKQLSFVLFEKLKLPPVKKTKTGFSTNAEVLDLLEPMHPIISKIKKYREMTKLLSTYVEVFLKKTNKNGVLHTTFLQAGPSTGRISSIEPNLQNLPSATVADMTLKSIVVPSDKDKIFVSADYSQIDLRVLAHFSEDPVLIEAFHNEKDIHEQTARMIFKLSPKDIVEEKMRKTAKTINFGIIYGMSAFGLSNALNISEKEASDIIRNYFASFPKVADFKKTVIEKAQKDGFVITLACRRRPVPEINSSNKQIQQLGERLAFNTIIQGSSADIIKTAMIRMHNELQRIKHAHLLLQIHDELIWECAMGEAEEVKCLALKEMEHAFALKVPLKVHIKKGNNLASLTTFDGL